MKCVLHFFPHKLMERHGGPYSVLFHLKKGLQNFDHNVQFLSDIIDFDLTATTAPKGKSPVSYLKLFIPKKWINNYRLFKWFLELRQSKDTRVNKIDLSTFDILHFHEPVDLWRYRSVIINFKGKIVLTTHSPKPYHLELIEDVMGLRKNDFSKCLFGYLQSIETYAYKKSDAVIFPSIFSADSFYELWPEFNSIVDRSIIFDIPTGIAKASITDAPSFVRQQYNIPDNAFIIAFVGRKIEAKGYDLLVKVAKELLPELPHLYFFIVGKKNDHPDFDHSRWIETGWTDQPLYFINAANLICVPNKYTNFDLNVLECMSLGKPLLLSLSGGNLAFKQFKSEGLFFCLTQKGSDDISRAITALYLIKDDLSKKGNQNRDIYSVHFTAEHFASRQLNFYETFS